MTFPDVAQVIRCTRTVRYPFTHSTTVKIEYLMTRLRGSLVTLEQMMDRGLYNLKTPYRLWV